MKRAVLAAYLLVVLLAPIMLLAQTNPEAYAQTKSSAPEFTVKFVDNSYDVPPIYGVDQFTGKNVITKEGYHVDNKTFEFTIKNQPMANYYNFRFKGQHGTEWTYYPEDSNGRSVIHYGGGIPVDDTQMYPPEYPASNSGDTTISLPLGLLGPPVGQAIPNGVDVDFQVQALIGHFNRNEFGYYVLTGESSDWSNTQTITISKSNPTGAIPPQITVQSPKAKTYTVSDIPLDFQGYSFDAFGVKYSLDGQENITFLESPTLTGLANGNHTLIMYANDSAGNTVASETVFFSVEVPEPFPTVTVAVSIVVAVVVCIGLLLYVKKRRRQVNLAKKP